MRRASHSEPDFKMAKRSDFAQKLLDDLRLRKERMAAASQTSNRSKTTTIDAYAYSKQIHRGSKNTKTHGMNVSKTGNTNMRYGGNNKPPMIQDNSNQIVPYNRGRNSEQIGDLSMALAFALENGGKLKRNTGNNLMLGFLQQIGRRSFDLGKINKSRDRLQNGSGYFPTISHLHIKEISNGAQKLNQILRTCSNGLHFGRGSIEIGQELLKGAMDLEESLRMLVNLHEASEHMISPQQKNRIVLLEDEEEVEEDGVETPDQKQLYQPRFSLDKFSLNSRSSQEARNGLKQNLATLRYSAEGGYYFSHEDQSLSTVKLSSHRKSASYGNDIKTSSTAEKVGISNVIAKLMGLDNISDNSSSLHQDSGSKQQVLQKDFHPTSKSSIQNAEPKPVIKNSWSCSNSKSSKRTAPEKNPTVVNPMFISRAMNNFPTNEVSLQAVGIHGKQPWKGIGEMRPETSPSTIAVLKQQQNNDEARQKVTSQKDYQEGITKQHQLKHRETKSTNRDENREGGLMNGVQQKDYQERNTKKHYLKNREPKAMERDEKREPSKNGVQQMEGEMHNKTERAIILQGYKERNVHLENRYPNKLQSRKQQKPANSPPGYQQPLKLHKAEMGEIKHHRKEKVQKSEKQKVLERNQKGSRTMPKSLTKSAHEVLTLPKKQQDRNHVRQSEKSYKETIVAQQSNMLSSTRCPEDLSRENTGYDINDKRSGKTCKSIDRNYSSRDSETKVGKEDFLIQPVVEKHHANAPEKDDVKFTRMQESESCLNSEEVCPREQKTPTFQEVEQKRHDTFDASNGPELLGANGSKEAEAHIIEFRREVEGVEPVGSTQDLHKVTMQVSTLLCPAEDESHNFKEPQISVPNDSDMQCQKTIPIHTSNQQEQISIFGRGEVNSSRIAINAVEDKYNTGILYSPQLEHLYNSSNPRKQEILTESENHLKQTLIASERLLNAAEALFKLNIPSFILHDIGHDHLKDGRNLIIDCSYEVMKRKGIRQELKNHLCTTISMRSEKIGTLDDLTKQLHKDIEALKFYGRNGKIECEVQDYLPKMLESDIYNKEPDLNSMWDLGWNDTAFAFLEREEVVRDVEKHVLSGLLDEVSRDLLHA